MTHFEISILLRLANLIGSLTKETKFGMAPAMIPKIPDRSKVEFQAIRRLQISYVLPYS